MSVTTKPHKWETRRLESWDKAKEIRLKYERNLAETEAKDEILVQGGEPYLFGFPRVRVSRLNPQGAIMSWTDAKSSREFRAAAEIRGHGCETCGYTRNVYGAIYLNRYHMGGEFPKPVLITPNPAPCDNHATYSQIPADLLNIPILQGSSPRHSDPPNPDRDKAMKEHVISELFDRIEEMERILGVKFDEERFIETAKSQMRLSAARADTFAYMQNIPAPLGVKDIYSFYTLGGLTRTPQQETEALWMMLRDEVKWRVDNQIAAVAYERFRWIEAMPPPWRFLKYYRYMERYGAVCLGSTYSALPYLEEQPDGTLTRAKTPLELGMPLNTVEDVFQATIGAGTHGGGTSKAFTYDETSEMMNLAKAYKANGAILPLWRSGDGCVQARREDGLALSGMGVNVMYYEGSQPGDPTDFDENRMLDQLDMWMESQGLRKIED